MFLRAFTTTAIAGAMALSQIGTAEADAGDFIGGAIVGGALGHLITKDQQQKKQRRTTTTRRVYRPGIPATQQGVQTQTALNYFGYNAGTVDGQIGPGTRRAIEAYQVSMGYPVNGRNFEPYQYDFLVQAYGWALNGGQAQTGLVGQPLLATYRQRVQTGTLYAGTPQVAPQAVVPQAAAPLTTTTGAIAAPTVPQPAPVAQNPVLEAAVQTPTFSPTTDVPVFSTETSEPAATKGTLPTLFAGNAPSQSLANRCNAVLLQTSSNGGYTTLDAMSDPDFALSEQFCLVRSHSIAQGEELMAQVQGLSSQQIAEQCNAFANMLKPHVDAISLRPQPEAESAMRDFALSTGIAPADLSGTSRVCLSVGYSQDNMNMALGSALLLNTLGEPAYGEILGHHLREGFGTTQRLDLAMGWYAASLAAIEGGAGPALVPEQADRPILLREATIRLQSGQQQGNVAPQTDTTATALPTFKVAQ